MVKTVLSTLIFLTLGLSSFGQMFKVDNSYVSLQGSTAEVISPPATIRNLLRSTAIIHWEISKKNLPDGWTIMVNDRYSSDKGILTLANSEVFSDFKVNFNPNGTMGVGSVEITLFDPNNRSNTETEVTFTASASPAISASTDVPQIFPNPATDYISLSNATGIRRIEILNTLGRKVLEFSVHSDLDKFDVSALPRGMYFVRLIDQQGNISRTQRISKYNP